MVNSNSDFLMGNLLQSFVCSTGLGVAPLYSFAGEGPGVRCIKLSSTIAYTTSEEEGSIVAMPVNLPYAGRIHLFLVK